LASLFADRDDPLGVAQDGRVVHLGAQFLKTSSALVEAAKQDGQVVSS
jgi:hypothetical protein